MAYLGEFTSFDDYQSRATGTNFDLRSTEEILAEMEEVERILQEGSS